MKNTLFCAAAVLALASASPAFAQAYSGGSGTFTGIGSDQNAYPGTPFDTVTLGALAGVYSGYGTYDINSVTFLAGVNRNDNGVFTGTLTGLTGLIGGNPFSYSVNYSIDVNNSDTITLGGNDFRVSGTSVHINPLVLNNGGGSASNGTLSVTTSVPEPATWTMMLAGFGLIGFGLRSRRKEKVRVAFA